MFDAEDVADHHHIYPDVRHIYQHLDDRRSATEEKKAREEQPEM